PVIPRCSPHPSTQYFGADYTSPMRLRPPRSNDGIEISCGNLKRTLRRKVIRSRSLGGDWFNSKCSPCPLPGGDLIGSFGLFNQFFTGVGPISDGLNAD